MGVSISNSSRSTHNTRNYTRACIVCNTSVHDNTVSVKHSGYKIYLMCPMFISVNLHLAQCHIWNIVST